MKSLGVQNNWENRKFVVEKSQFYWVMFRMLSILPLPLSLIVPTIRIESWVFNGIAHVKAGVSRYYYGLKFVKENVSKQVEKMVEKCQGLLQKSSAKTHTLLLFPIFENLSYGATWPRLRLGGVVLWPSLVKIFPKKTGCWRRIVLKEDLVAEDKPKLGATWPRLLLEVWSCGRVVGNGTEETVIPNGVLTVQMVGFFSCSLLLGEFSSSLFIISLGHSLLGGVVLCLSMMLVS